MLAIIIPYYKLTFFEATLKSLSNQKDKRFKVYIGDDASPENPSALLKQFKGEFDFSYHRFENNLGSKSLTKQWDRCIALSNNEEWILILGDDDVLGNNVVEEFYKNLEEIKNKNISVVRFASQVINELGETKSEIYTHPKIEKASDWLYKKFKCLTRSSLSEYVFKKSSYLENGFRTYPLGWYSDDMAWIDFAQNNLISTINDCYIKVRISNINITGKKDNFLVKNKSELLFYTDLVYEKLFLFNRFQKNEFLLAYEIAIKKIRKVNFQEWLFLFDNYARNREMVPFLKLIRRFLKNYTLL